VEHLRERLQALLKELGFEPGELHAFRRFFISHCANQGVPPTVLMRWVGHADLRMIIRYYTLRDDESQEAMDDLRGGAKSPGFKTVLRQTGVPEKQLRSQRPAFRIVTTAS
jgi:integrase